jgi:hypothetical protein
MTLREASQLLSAIMFIDLNSERYHVFPNPRAKNPIPARHCESHNGHPSSNRTSRCMMISSTTTTKPGPYNADLIALLVDGKFILLPPKDKEAFRSKFRSQGGGLRLATFLRCFNSYDLIAKQIAGKS